MKKAIYLISIVIFLFGCASTPEIKVPVAESIVKLLMAKEIQCDFTKAVVISLTEEELEVEKHEELGEEGVKGLHLQIKIDSKSDNATIYIELELMEISGFKETYTTKVQRWDESISFIFDDEDGAIVTIVVFNTDDDFSDYEATLSGSGYYYDHEIFNWLGYCKVID